MSPPSSGRLSRIAFVYPQSPKIHPDAKIMERECAHMRGETRARRDGRVRAPARVQSMRPGSRWL